MKISVLEQFDNSCISVCQELDQTSKQCSYKPKPCIFHEHPSQWCGKNIGMAIGKIRDSPRLQDPLEIRNRNQTFETEINAL